MLKKRKLQKTNTLTKEELERLLNQQTLVILNAVDVKIERVNKRIDRMEERFAKKLDKLTATLDKFLKRMTDLEDEFALMKNDLRRVKTVLKEKLGVDLV